VDIAPDGADLIVTITDDGVGGADPATGSGLRGLVDRVHAIGGRLHAHPPAQTLQTPNSP
jgi:signal transduction histidine kinase